MGRSAKSHPGGGLTEKQEQFGAHLGHARNAACCSHHQTTGTIQGAGQHKLGRNTEQSPRVAVPLQCVNPLGTSSTTPLRPQIARSSAEDFPGEGRSRSPCLVLSGRPQVAVRVEGGRGLGAPVPAERSPRHTRPR